DEDIASLRSRVAQLSTPELTVAENPRSIDRRFVANVRVAREGERILVASNVLLRRVRGVGTEPCSFSTARRDVLRKIDGNLRLAVRPVQLDDPVVGSSRLAIFF